jgi:hypothetical protein
MAVKPDRIGLLLDSPAPSTAKPMSADGSGVATSGSGKALRDAFMVAGNFSCAPRIKQVGDYLLRGAESGAFLFFNEASPDQRQVGVALEIASPASGTSSYASAEFSPEASGDCGASYQAIAYWPALSLPGRNFPTTHRSDCSGATSQYSSSTSWVGYS